MPLLIGLLFIGFVWYLIMNPNRDSTSYRLGGRLGRWLDK